MRSSQVILISGTSRGLGAHLRSVLEARGHTVYGSSRRASDEDQHELSLDVTHPQSCERAVDHIVTREGRVDVVINNAGSHLLGAAVETSEAELRAQMELNFFGAVHLTEAVVRASMLERRSGRIINVSSVGGRFATPFASAYCASKFALEGYMEALRLELLPFSIYVSNLEPGFLRTETTATSVIPVESGHPLYASAREATRERMLREGAEGIPLERVSRVIDEILSTPEPKLRYSVDGLVPRLSLLRGLSPSAWFERTVVKQTAPAFAEEWARRDR